MIGEHPSENVRTVVALVLPFVLTFGVYVIAHGHYGPGGGFAGGVILAVAVVLARVTLSAQTNRRFLPPRLAVVAMASGMTLFLAAALVPMLTGGLLLDYSAVDLGDLSDSRVRYFGIFVVEVGVGAAVFGGVVLIFDRLTATEGHR